MEGMNDEYKHCTHVNLTSHVILTLQKISVFTTRADTLLGVTYVTLAPEHPLYRVFAVTNNDESVEDYVEKTSSRSDLDRTSQKEKTGVFTGGYALHPLTNEKIPIWVGDYVLGSYGTGAVMAVPAHDARDYEFAIKFDLPIQMGSRTK